MFYTLLSSTSKVDSSSSTVLLIQDALISGLEDILDILRSVERRIVLVASPTRTDDHRRASSGRVWLDDAILLIFLEYHEDHNSHRYDEQE